MVFTSCLLGNQKHKRYSVEKMPVSLLVVSLGKALQRDVSIFMWQTDVAGPSSLFVVVAQSEERHANKA